ncbi:MAG: hypothetical protein Q4D04_13960 [Clostridia bacterium]|nr:hypothetical protein [Clostridia bacterium]
MVAGRLGLFYAEKFWREMSAGTYESGGDRIKYKEQNRTETFELSLGGKALTAEIRHIGGDAQFAFSDGWTTLLHGASEDDLPFWFMKKSEVIR